MSETLLPRNQEYYDRLAAYVTDAIGVDGKAAEETMAEIHADLLQAQANGISAADYFGHDPKTIGNQLVATLPHLTWQDWLRFAVIAWAISFLVFAWRFIANGLSPVPLGTAAVLAIILPVGVLVGMAVYRYGTFTRKKFRDSGIIVLIVCQTMLLPVSDLFPKFGRVVIPPTALAVVGFGMASVLIGFGIWLGMHSWVFAALCSVFATLFALPAADALGTLPGWWGRLLIPGIFLLFMLIIRGGDALLPAKWQAKAGN